jgi:hypothetical protein
LNDLLMVTGRLGAVDENMHAYFKQIHVAR